MRPIKLCTVTDLPQPDSPTMARVWPAKHVKADTAHRLNDTSVGLEIDVQIVDL